MISVRGVDRLPQIVPNLAAAVHPQRGILGDVNECVGRVANRQEVVKLICKLKIVPIAPNPRAPGTR